MILCREGGYFVVALNKESEKTVIWEYFWLLLCGFILRSGTHAYTVCKERAGEKFRGLKIEFIEETRHNNVKIWKHYSSNVKNVVVVTYRAGWER